MQEDLLKKLDARSRWQLNKHRQNGSVDVFLRLTEVPTTEQEETLAQINCRVRTRAGTILTAAISSDDLPKLAKLPFVEKIEISRQLFDENKAG